MIPMYPVFKSLSISGWRQFYNVSIEFHPRLTVITGANGAGKSSLLGLLTPHFGWQRTFLGTPRKVRKNGVVSFLTGVRKRHRSQVFQPGTMQEVGQIVYSTAVTASIGVSNEGQQYNASINNQQQVLGTFLASHRAVPVYQSVVQVSANSVAPDQAYSLYHSESVNRWAGNHHGPGPIYRLKESLVSMAMFGSKTEYSGGDESAIANLNGFVEVLRKVLPSNLGFKDLSIRTTDVVLETETGNFVIDAASGGVMALIDLAWQIYIYSLTTSVQGESSFTVVMDEPENHLHPSMQRSLLSNLLAAFPRAQFIIATHSPFMVSSVKDSYVYALRYVGIDQEGSLYDESDDGPPPVKLVFSEKLDVINRAGTAGDILRDVLGVPVTVPEWVEAQLDALVNEYRDQEVSADNLNELRNRMAALGFGELYPRALSQLFHIK